MHFHKTHTRGFSVVVVLFLALLGRAEAFSYSANLNCDAGSYKTGSQVINNNPNYEDRYRCSNGFNAQNGLTQYGFGAQTNQAVTPSQQYFCNDYCVNHAGLSQPATFFHLQSSYINYGSNYGKYHVECYCHEASPSCNQQGTNANYYYLTRIEPACTNCGSGTYQPNAGTSSSCITKTVTSCAAGQGFLDGGTTAENSCTACGAGFFQPNNGSTNVCTAWTLSSCPAGEFFTAGSTSTDSTCTPCPDGEYSSGGTATACLAKNVTSCPSAEGLTDGGNSTDNSCATCLAGTAKLGVNADACEACPVGTFSAAGASQCTPWVTKTCPAGQQHTDEGREADASCQPCPTGTYKQGTNADQCSVCLAGSEVTPVDSSSGATGCQLCTRASHWDSSGTSVVGCETFSGCPKGHHMIITPPDEINLCHACPSGTFQKDENSTATSCSACGFFQFSLAGSDLCAYFSNDCPAGFQSSTGMQKTHDRECAACPSGTYKATSGSASCAAHATPSCPVGKEARGTSTADATCQACPAGMFKATVGTEKCAAHKAPCDAIEQTETTAPSATEDRVCANKYVYADATTCCSEWQDANGDCQFYKTECGPGFALQDDGGIANDKTCQACPTVFHEITSGAQDDSVGEADCDAVQTYDFGSDTPAGCFKDSVSGNRMYNTGTSTTACSTSYPCIQATFMFKAGTNADACTGHRTTCPEGTELNKNGNSTKDHACDPCQAGDFKAGTNADECATCASGTWTSDNVQCVAHTVCDATTEVQLAAGTTSSDTVCGCAADHYSDGSACQACGAGETRLAGDSKTTTTQCCSVAYQNASTEVCTPYSEDAASCNAQRKPFVDGDASTDASCAAACNSTTEYASGASCVAYTTTCPAGQQLSTTLTPAADLQCSACPQGTYKEASGGEACAVCAQGNEIIPLDATEGGTGCAPCDKTQEFDADGSHTACVATEAHCDKGFFFHETAVDQANTCTPCASGTYQPLDNTTNACVAWTVCLGTEIEAISPTSSRNRVCACAADHHLGLPAHASVTQIDFGHSGIVHYVVNGQNDPIIHLCKDTNIVLKRTSDGHPLRIVSEAECSGKGCDAGAWTGWSSEYDAIAGFTDIQGNQNATVNLPEGVYYYLCTAHRDMVGKIIVGSCDATCQACGAGETRLAGDAKDEAVTSCCANSYQLAAKGACQAATDCAATSELVKTALSASSDRVCECAANYRYDGSGACQACGAGETRLAGDAKVGASKACCSSAFQASVGGSCTPWLTSCSANHELTGGTASAQKTCVACASTKQSTGGAACKTFAERHYSSSKPTTKAGIETALTNSKANYRSTSVKNTRMDFRSMIKFMKTEIAALTGRRVKLEKSKMVLSSKFSASLGSRTEVDVVVPKPKTKLDQADACTEKDIDISSQTEAYDVSLEEGEVSLICTGTTPMTKLRFEQDSNLHTGVSDDTYKYSCWTGSAWDTEVSVTTGDDYKCGSNTYYVNSHSGVTCTATAPVSSLDSAVVAGTNTCGTVGEGHECTDFACNANFVLQTAPNCTSAGYTPAVCHCPANFYEDGTGQCTAHSTEAQLGCNALRKKYVLGTATTDAACGDQCTLSQYASGEVCVPYSTDEATCSAARKTYQAGTENVDASCPALCLETQYVSSNQCLDLLAQCADGKELTGGSNTTNRACTACASGQYKTGTNADSCQACAAGSEIIPIGATSEGTACEVCTVAHEYDHDNNAVTGCLTTNSTCDNSYQILVTSGTQPNLCVPCASGTFQPDDTTTNQCQAHTVVACGDGEELTTAPNAMRDGVCTPCAGGKYKLGTNTAVCVEHSNCPVGEGKTADGTASADTQCTACNVQPAPVAVSSRGYCSSDTVAANSLGTLTTSTTNAEAVEECSAKCLAEASCDAFVVGNIAENAGYNGCFKHDSTACPNPAETSALYWGTFEYPTTGGTASTFSNTDDKSACQAHATCAVGEGLLVSGNSTHNTLCGPCVGGSTFSVADDKTACQSCAAVCGAGEVETTACTSSQNRVCETGQCTSMPVFGNEVNADAQGTCTGTLTHGQTCKLSCAAGFGPALYTCNTETLAAPATACVACEAYEHSDGDAACATDAAYTACQCTDASCTGVAANKYFVIGTSTADNSQCLDVTIKEASDCPDGSEFTSANTPTANGVCTPCGANEFSSGGATCQAHSTCPVGKGKTVDGTNAGDTQCAACTGYFFSASNDTSVCQQHSTCGVGRGKTADGTASTDTVCEDCTGDTFSSSNDKTACQAHATCAVGRGKTTDGTASVDTQCEHCTGNTFSDVDDRSACQAHATCPAGKGQTKAGNATSDTVCTDCGAEFYSSADDNTACQACATCLSGQSEITACSSAENRVCVYGQCSTMPVFGNVANADGQGTCVGNLSHSQTCKLSCEAGHHPALYTCNTNTLNAPTTPCMVCEAYEHSDGDSHCANDTAYTACQCLSAACPEAVAIDKYFVLGNSDNDDSQCLDATIRQASDCPDGSEFTSANTGTANGVCTPCGANEFSSGGATCQAHSTCPIGEGKTADGTNAADTQCAACGAGFFSAVDDKSACNAHSDCDIGYGKTADGTASTDTVCAFCGAGGAGYYSSVEDKSACVAHSTCPVGEGKTQSGTASADLQCGACGAGTFSAADDREACQAHSNCPVGEGKTADGTASADTQCTACGTGFFSALNDKSACNAHSNCDVGYGKTADGTASADTQCAACGTGSYSTVEDKSACLAHSTCAAGRGQTTAGTASTNAVCADCAAGFYSEFDDNTACQAHSLCAAGMGVLVAGSSTTDTTCENCVAGTSYSESASATETCQTCAATCLEEEAITCTASQNRVCGTLEPCTMPAHTTKTNTDSAGTCLAQLASSTSCAFSCTAGFSAASYSCYNGTLTEPAEACNACQLYEHSDGDAANCTIDAAYTACGCTTAACVEATGLGKYFVIGNSNLDDSQCLALTITQADHCSDGSEYTAPTGIADGFCTACEAGNFSASGAACQAHSTQCSDPETEYITHAGSLVADIQCSALLVCGATQLVSVAPTANAAGAFVTDRQCGCLDTETISGDKCLCKADYHVSGGVCLNCSVGYSRPAGDEKTGGDTACAESACTSFPALGSVPFSTAVGSCTGSLAHGGSCSYTCDAGFQAQSFTCDKGVIKEPLIPCLCPAHEHESGGACVVDTAYTSCQCSTTACPEMDQVSKFFSIGTQDNLDSSECRAPTFVEEKLGTAARPTTETAITAVIGNFRTNYIDAASNSGATAAVKKEQFKSVITYAKREIAKLPDRRVAISKASFVASQDFLDAVPVGKSVDIVVPKPKAPATVNDLSTACTQGDIQLDGQDNAFDVALGVGDTSLVCHGSSPKTKLTRNSGNYKYSCAVNNAWSAETIVNEDSSYTCPDGGKYFVNSHGGGTCAVQSPVSQSFPSITSGTSGDDCGSHIAFGTTCSYECNSNFVKVSGPSCSSTGVFTRAVCSCVQDGFVDDAQGSCVGCASGTFSTAGQACVPWTVTEATCNADNKIFVAGTINSDSSCGITCANGLVADGAICKEASTVVSCAALQWMYFSDTCCESAGAISCMSSLTEEKVKIVDSVATLKQDEGTDCTNGMEVVFKDGKIVCR